MYTSFANLKKKNNNYEISALEYVIWVIVKEDATF